jgi:sphinganine-1-phosphate aldolase
VAADAIFKTAAKIRAGIESIPELQVIGKPTFLVAFRSPDLNIYHVNDHLIEKGWRLNALQLPAALHFCVTRPNTASEIAEAFVDDLQDAVDYAKHPSRAEPKSGALYGLGGTPSGNEILDVLFTAALDAMYEVAPTEAGD